MVSFQYGHATAIHFCLHMGRARRKLFVMDLLARNTLTGNYLLLTRLGSSGDECNNDGAGIFVQHVFRDLYWRFSCGQQPIYSVTRASRNV